MPGKLVLSPTRTYAPVVKKLLEVFVPTFMVWCIVQVVRRLKSCILLTIWKWWKQSFPRSATVQINSWNNQGTDWKKCTSFQYGTPKGWKCIFPTNMLNKWIDIAQSFNIEAQIVGYCRASDKKELLIESEFGRFEYWIKNDKINKCRKISFSGILSYYLFYVVWSVKERIFGRATDRYGINVRATTQPAYFLSHSSGWEHYGYPPMIGSSGDYWANSNTDIHRIERTGMAGCSIFSTQVSKPQ